MRLAGSRLVPKIDSADEAETCFGQSAQRIRRSPDRAPSRAQPTDICQPESTRRSRAKQRRPVRCCAELCGVRGSRAFLRPSVHLALCRRKHAHASVADVWKNRGAEVAVDTSRLLAEFFLEDRGSLDALPAQTTRRSRSSWRLVRHRNGQWAMLTHRAAVLRTE